MHNYAEVTRRAIVAWKGCLWIETIYEMRKKKRKNKTRSRRTYIVLESEHAPIMFWFRKAVVVLFNFIATISAEVRQAIQEIQQQNG